MTAPPLRLTSDGRLTLPSATCHQCAPKSPVMFATEPERDRWVTAHRHATEHTPIGGFTDYREFQLTAGVRASLAGRPVRWWARTVLNALAVTHGVAALIALWMLIAAPHLSDPTPPRSFIALIGAGLTALILCVGLALTSDRV